MCQAFNDAVLNLEAPAVLGIPVSLPATADFFVSINLRDPVEIKTEPVGQCPSRREFPLSPGNTSFTHSITVHRSNEANRNKLPITDILQFQSRVLTPFYIAGYTRRGSPR